MLAFKAFDEMPGTVRQPLPELALPRAASAAGWPVTAGELIAARVVLELERRGTALPTAARMGHADEWRLDPRRRDRKRAPFDPEVAQARALAAFARGGIILLVDDVQIEGADTVIDVARAGEITFLQLVPLVGG